MAPPGFHQHGVIADPPLAEAKVVPHHHMLDPQGLQENALNEGLGGQAGKGLVEPADHHIVDPAFSQQFQLFPQGGEPSGGGVGGEKFPGMGFKGQHGPRQAQGLRLFGEPMQ